MSFQPPCYNPRNKGATVTPVGCSATSASTEASEKTALERSLEDSRSPSVVDETPTKELRILPGPEDRSKAFAIIVSSPDAVAISPASESSSPKGERSFACSGPEVDAKARFDQAARSPVHKLVRLTRAPAGSLRFFLDTGSSEEKVAPSVAAEQQAV